LESLGLVLSFQEPEKTGGVLITLQMKLVHLCADPAHRYRTTVSEPELALCVLKERITAGKVLTSFHE
jgi:hypothetical protein